MAGCNKCQENAKKRAAARAAAMKKAATGEGSAYAKAVAKGKSTSNK